MKFAGLTMFSRSMLRTAGDLRFLRGRFLCYYIDGCFLLLMLSMLYWMPICCFGCNFKLLK